MENKAKEMVVEEEAQQQEETTNNNKEIEDMTKRLEEIEHKAAEIRERMQAAKLFASNSSQGPSQAGNNNQMGNSKSVEEAIDPLSIYVGNVDYECTAEEVQQHFMACGDVSRVTILSNEYGQPKGFAYVEFADEEAVQEALRLNQSELHGRKLKVMRKRRNLPGMKQYPPRRYNPYGHYSPSFMKPQ